MLSEETKLIMHAANYAAVAHQRQLRKDGQTPFINHPIGVAHILTDLGGVTEPNILAAALLHDTVEDTSVTIEDIEREFGASIRSIVAEVTDDKSLPKEETKRLQIVHAPHLSREAKLVKLADKLYNLEDLLRCTPIGWTEQRVQEFFEWAAKVIEGIRGTNPAIEARLVEVLSKRNVTLN